MIDISRGKVNVKLNSYNGSNVNTNLDHNLWIAQYDENKNFISGSRKELYLSNGSIKSFNLLTFQNKTPAQAVIAVENRAKYAIIFNFFTGSIVDLEVYIEGEKSLVDRVSD